MALYKLVVDTDTGMPLEEIRKHLAPGHIIERIDYTKDLRDMTIGWHRVAVVQDLFDATAEQFRALFPEAGVYALCYEPDMDIEVPVLTRSKVAKFSETIRDSNFRAQAHIQALKGCRSNVYDSWRDAAKTIHEQIGCDIYKDCKDMTMWVRPHRITDPHDFSDIRHTPKFSAHQEKWAQAFHKAYSGEIAPANNRDLPNYEMIKEARDFLIAKGYLTKT